MDERKEEINLGLRESRLMNLMNLTNLCLSLFIMCDFFLTKYINSKSQTLKLFDRACSTPSLNLGCMKTVFTKHKIKVSVKIRSGIFPNVLLRINMLLDCSHGIYLQETGFSTAALWRAVWPVYPATKT